MIFVDTSFWLALRNRADPLNQEAGELLLLSEPETLVTTPFVVAETCEILHRRTRSFRSRGFIDDLALSPRTRIVPLSPAMQMESLAWLRRHMDRPFSPTVASTVPLLWTQRISRVLAFNADYEAAGFEPLRD